jgi:prepilin-type processing-associated H-X9-DG protein
MAEPVAIMKRNAYTTNGDGGTSTAFTLTELLVVICVLAILVLTVLPALGRRQPNSKSARCQHNLRQLAVAWQSYAEDYSGKIVPNYHGGIPPGWSWSSGWLDWSLYNDNTNVLLLIDARYALLAPYVHGAANLFKCPADQYLSLQQRARGWTQRVRSYSANIYIGEGNGNTGPTSPIYKQITKTSEFHYPPPAQAWVYVDEHPDSINDPAFFAPRPTTWVDWPATYHNGGTGFAFADGHAEMRKWRGSLAVGPATRVTYFNSNLNSAPAWDVDISWMSFRTPRVSSVSY